MKLLLDTHVLLWATTALDRLAPEARAMLEDGTHDVLVSVVCAWEIAIDRLLIAQALDQGYTIVTRDTAFDAYGVPVVRA